MTTRAGVRLGAAFGLGYLAGTFPSADLATRLAARGTDLRTEGSGNPGALNAAAVLGRRWGLAVLAADMAKGTIAGLVGRAVAGDAGAYAAATGSIAGHIAPVWNGFQGGKGVATSAGACLAVFPVYFPIDAAVAATSAAASQQAERSIQVACAGGTTAAGGWGRRGLPNAWGPETGPGLPLFAAASSAMILAKFRSTRRTSA
ncbi:MAG: glycerol-3-phosphate acyltransferase [Acidimicrobiia bacterium]|nr:glycerol-3-phosphate acyltransferase [Acidimicrobiia bacterium]